MNISQKYVEEQTGTDQRFKIPKDTPLSMDDWLSYGEVYFFSKQMTQWSEATFGSTYERGPVGPIRHLRKETHEMEENPYDVEEYADGLFLLFAAAHRAGFTLRDLMDACWAKLEKNKARQWEKPKSGDEPTEHVRTSKGMYDYNRRIRTYE